MATPDPSERYLARQARLVGAVLVMTMLLWLGAQWLGGEMGWQPKYVFLFDLAALAAFMVSCAVQVGIEEKHLETNFGEPYRDFRASVPRWIGIGGSA